MAKIRGYKGQALKDPLGEDTNFRIFPSGTIYDFHGVNLQVVGKMDKKGRVHVKGKYVERNPERARVLRELLTEEPKEKAND